MGGIELATYVLSDYYDQEGNCRRDVDAYW